jgi:anti-anti-sigma regulatory factor
MTATHIEITSVDDKCWARVQGSGTMAHGPTILHCLEAISLPTVREIWLDLAECDRVDSTFAGCLVGFHQKGLKGDAPALILNAPSERCLSALRQMSLDKFLMIRTESAPQTRWETFDGTAPDKDELARTVIDAHADLATSHPDNAPFKRIADAMERDHKKDSSD